MMVRRIILLLIFSVLTLSCEERFETDLEPKNTNLLVVEGLLTNENTNHRVKLTHPHQFPNEDPIPATGAFVIITDGENLYGTVEFPVGSGEYYTPEFRAVFGRIYTLFIQYQGKEFFAWDSPPPVEPLPTFQYRPAGDPEAGLFTLTLNGSGDDPNFIEHYIIWENTEFCAFTEGACLGKVVFYDLKTIEVHEFFKPDQADFVFPLNSVVVRRKHSVSESYRVFLRSVLSETEWRGGVFDVARANVPTNLSEGAIGFFAVSTVISDTTVITELP